MERKKYRKPEKHDNNLIWLRACAHEYGAVVSHIRQHQHTGPISAGTFSHMHLEIL